MKKLSGSEKIIISIILCCLALQLLAFCLYEPVDKYDYTAEERAQAEQVADDEIIVYVSESGGKIHKRPNCSGMKYYEKMSYEKARRAGYDLCENCY